jgi:Domain of Unknown Function with PDB structure (DUF3857)/Transglutaminase-like superfamily
MKIILNLFLFITVLSLSAQSSFDATSFKVTKGDLETNTYPQDSTANALVIYEYGNSYVDFESYNIITKIKRKVKIFNKEGANNATIKIYLYNDKLKKERIKQIVATTHNLSNGKIIKTTLKKNEIFEELYDKNNTIIKFTLPKIQKGSVITYSYTLESPFMYKFKDWVFQESIPKIYSRYETNILLNYEYNIKLIGPLKLSEKESKIVHKCHMAYNGVTADCIKASYAMVDIPAFIKEDYMTVKENYLSRIDYELKTFIRFDGVIDNITRTWKDTDKEIKTIPSIGRQINSTSVVKNLFNYTTTEKPNLLEKAKAVYDYIQKNYSWNEEYLTFKDASLRDLVKDKTGNVSQINILLNNLLEKNGIDSKTILLSTRSNGFATKLFPVISDFNYLIVQATINGKSYLLDATDKYLSFGQLPFRCLNYYGRLLDFKNGSEWVDITEDKVSTIQYQVNLNLAEEDVIRGTVNSRFAGYFALSKKKKYYSNASNYIENFKNEYDNLEITNHSIKSKYKTAETFQESFDIEYTEFEEVGDEIYFDPFIHKFFTENPFKLQQRTYPVEFGYKKAFLYSYQLDLGSAYEVKELPKDLNVKLPNNTGEFLFVTKIANNKLNIFFKVNFKESVYDSSYYSYLKEFMSRIVDTQTKTLIVLKKK